MLHPVGGDSESDEVEELEELVREVGQAVPLIERGGKLESGDKRKEREEEHQPADTRCSQHPIAVVAREVQKDQRQQTGADRLHH